MKYKIIVVGIFKKIELDVEMFPNTPHGEVVVRIEKK